ITRWDFDELPRYVDTRHAGNTIRGYPALVDDGASVSIRIMATEADQRRAMPGGVRRLLLLAVASPVSYVQQHLTSAEKLVLATSPYPTTQALFDDCLTACIDDILFRVVPDGCLYMRVEFETVRDRISGAVMNTMFDTVSLTAKVLTAARTAEKALKRATSLSLLPALSDATGQLNGLVFAGFVSATGTARLAQVPRYLAGIAHRAEKLPDNPNRDRVWMNEIQAATALFEAAGGTIPLDRFAPPHLVKARWMLEELRLSLFAQNIGAAETVSLQRIRKVLAG
ncbi:MAG: DUF3418 domain-containing protein, partial [Mycetocola sp.]